MMKMQIIVNIYGVLIIYQALCQVLQVLPHPKKKKKRFGFCCCVIAIVDDDDGDDFKYLKLLSSSKSSKLRDFIRLIKKCVTLSWYIIMERGTDVSVTVFLKGTKNSS